MKAYLGWWTIITSLVGSAYFIGGNDRMAAFCVTLAILYALLDIKDAIEDSK